MKVPYLEPAGDETVDASYDPRLHTLALLTTAATFPLIFLGGLVTSKSAGLSVPDWPNSYGYNMFLFPPNRWVGGIFFEHTHRLLGTLVGFLAVSLALKAWAPARRPDSRRVILLLLTWATALALMSAVLAGLLRGSHGLAALLLPHISVGWASLALLLFVAWLCRRREERRWVRWLMIGVLTAVIFQGILGGLRVTAVNLDLAVIHACFAQAFFCLCGLTCVATSRWWQNRKDESRNRRAGDGRWIVRLGIACVAIIYCQLIVGALMRHHGAGLAIPDLPLHYGQILPPTDNASLTEANEYRRWKLDPPLPEVSLEQVWLHFGHRVGAVVVTIAVVAFAAAAFSRGRGSALSAPAALLLMLLVAQITLGVLTVIDRKPADIASLHVATGALTLLIAFVMTIRALRLYWQPVRDAVPAVDARAGTFVTPAVSGG